MDSVIQVLHRVKTSLLDGQYSHPTGIVGRVLGERMVRQHAPETRWTLALLDVRPADRVLELGFGAGKAVELVAREAVAGHVDGIDISQTMVRVARRRNVRAIRAGRVALREGNVMSLPFADNQFDRVFSIQTFYFWPDHLRALAEIFRVLKPDSRLVITLSTGTVEVSSTTGLEYYNTFLTEQILPGMYELGFTTVSIQQGPYSRQFKTTALIAAK